MSIRIGICSDRICDIKYIRKVIREEFSGIEYSYDFDFFNTDKCVEAAVVSLEYDIFFIDLDMPGYDMLGVLASVSNNNPLANIILLSNQHELVFETIKYRPFRFIRKEFLYVELAEAIGAVVSKIANETILYDAEHEHDSVKVRLLDVDYIESEGHYLNFHTGDNGLQIRGKISEYEEKLAAYGFIRIHRGYLANVRSIYSFNSKYISMDNGEVLPVSRKNAETIKLQYDRCIKKFVRGINRQKD